MSESTKKTRMVITILRRELPTMTPLRIKRSKFPFVSDDLSSSSLRREHSEVDHLGVVAFCVWRISFNRARGHDKDLLSA